jgi:dihydroxyacetone kinase-like protein
MRAGMATDGKQELTDEDLLKMFESGLEGVIQRGKANPGDKTMIDALQPAIQAFSHAITNDHADTVAGMRRAVAAAEEGMRGTIPLVARKGRASYLGERSAGHQDPGATSSYLILNALLDVISSE